MLLRVAQQCMTRPTRQPPKHPAVTPGLARRTSRPLQSAAAAESAAVTAALAAAEQARGLHATASRLFGEHNWEKAGELFEQAVEVCPRNHVAILEVLGELGCCISCLSNSSVRLFVWSFFLSFFLSFLLSCFAFFFLLSCFFFFFLFFCVFCSNHPRQFITYCLFFFLLFNPSFLIPPRRRRFVPPNDRRPRAGRRAVPPAHRRADQGEQGRGRHAQ